jgi:S-adenosylmethionine:tRNA ribosyltransferase-isomerase
VKTDAFDYPLPEGLIAQHPLPERSDSRLLVYDRGLDRIAHEKFSDLPGLLPEGACLVVNNSKVIPARLWGTKEGGGARIETILLEAFGDGRYKVLANRARRLRKGSVVVYGRDLRAVVEERLENGMFAFRFESEGPLAEALDRAGEMPLPPYIRRDAPDPEDRDRYQTVYARDTGSAAAPTAGLHFDQALLDEVSRRAFGVVEVTLHVGLDTFRPIAEPEVERHPMHTEWYRVSAEAAVSINAAREQGKRIVAVGTTSVRVLESAADAHGRIEPHEGRTDLFIRPGYRFRVVDHLITNFHLPRSTLILLVAAFIGGDRWRKVYEEAIRQRYRFYSYGDAMLIL